MRRRNWFGWTVLLAALIAVSPVLPHGRGVAQAGARSGRFVTDRQPARPLPPISPQPLAELTPPGNGALTLRGAMDGRIKNLRFDRQNPSNLFALFSDGVNRSGDGLVTSTDLGTTWQVHTNTQQIGFSRYYEIDPSNAQRRFADELLTTDGGQVWIMANVGLPGTLQQVVWSPVSGSTLYGLRDDIIYQSTDGAFSWATKSSPHATVGTIVADPTDATTLYSIAHRELIAIDDYSYPACYTGSFPTATPNKCFARSIDGGQTWTDIAVRLGVSGADTQYAAATGLWPAKSADASPNPLFASVISRTVSGAIPEAFGVYRSLDAGATWAARNSGLPRHNGNAYRLDYVGITGAISVAGSIQDNQTLYVIGRGRFNGADPKTEDRLFRSKDAGATWTEIPTIGASPIPTNTYQQISGVFVEAGNSVDNAKVFVARIVAHRGTNEVLEHLSGVWRSLDNGATWQKADSGLSNHGFGWTILGPDNALYSESAALSVLRSADGGATWAPWSNSLTHFGGPNGSGGFNRGLAVNSLAFDPQNPAIAWIGTSEGAAGRLASGILRSTDGGATWGNTGIGIGAQDAAILGVLPTTPRTLFASAGGKLYRATDNGASSVWSALTGPGSPTGFWFNPQNLQILYVTGGSCGGCTLTLWRSKDGGNTWTSLGDNADSFAIDPNDPERIYKSSGPATNASASREGIDVSDDGGDTWTTIESGGFGPGRRLLGLLPTNPAILLSTIREASGLSYQIARTDYSIDGGKSFFPLGDWGTYRSVPGPVSTTNATFYLPGVVFKIGRATRNIRGDPLDILLFDGRAGLWGYTFTFSGGGPQAIATPSLSFGQASYRFTESSGGGNVTVNLSTASPYDTPFRIRTVPGSADGNDYTSFDMTAIISAGLTSMVFPLQITRDGQTELDEEFTLELADPQYAALGSPSTATVTIGDAGPATPTPGAATPTPTGTPIPNGPPVQGGNNQYLPYASKLANTDGVSPTPDPNAPPPPPPPSPTPTGQTAPSGRTRVIVEGVPANAAEVRLRVTAETMAGELTVPAKIQGTSAIVSVDLPASLGTLVRAEALAGGSPVAQGAAIAWIVADAPGEMTVTLATSAPAIDCAAMALTPGAGAPGKRLRLTGFVPGSGKTLALYAGNILMPSIVDGSGYSVIVPLSNALPAGTSAPLTLVVNGQVAPCSLPPLQVLAATPAPGELERVGASYASLFDDIAVLALGPGDEENRASLFFRALSENIMQNIRDGKFKDPGGQSDSLLSEMGMLTEIQQGRSTFAAEVAAVRARLGDRPPSARTAAAARMKNFTTAQQLLDDQRAYARIQNKLGSPEYVLFKNGVSLLFLAAGTAISGPAFGLLYAFGVYIINAVWSTIEYYWSKHVKEFYYYVGKVDATPPTDPLVAGGPPISWKGGAIDATRPAYTLAYRDILTLFGSILFAAIGVQPAFAKVLDDDVLVTIVFGIIGWYAEFFNQYIGLIGIGFPTDNASWGQKYPEHTINNLTLGDLANVIVDPAGRIQATKGNPGRLQACNIGPATVTVGVNQELLWLDSWDGYQGARLDHQAKFEATSTGGGPQLGCSGFIQLAGGTDHTIGVTSDGRVYTWGANAYGQLGNGGTTASLSPTLLPAPLLNIIAVAAGKEFSLALDSEGRVWSWGRNTDGQLGNGSKGGFVPTPAVVGFGQTRFITSIAAGERFSLAANSDGVWAWGNNAYGQLGNGTYQGSTSPVAVQSIENVTKLAAGRTHALALVDGGLVWSWGYNAFGQLGDYTTMDHPSPTVALIHSRTGVLERAKDIAAGGLHSVVLDLNNNLITFGWNQYGQLGNHASGRDVNYVPVHLKGDLPRFKAVAAGSVHSLAVAEDGTLYAWGRDLSGQLGIPNSTGNWNYPVKVPGLANLAGIAAGWSASYAVADEQGKTAYAWGENGTGQVGNGQAGADVDTPIKVVVAPGG
ncbi:MAG: Calx-beta domain-containing protein [Dehalococcoidia bacterium]